MQRITMVAAIAASTFVSHLALEAQSIHPDTAFRDMQFDLHAHGADGDADAEQTDVTPTEFGFWEHVQTPSVTQNGASATATTLHRSLIRDGVVNGRVKVELGTVTENVGEEASASANAKLSANFTVDTTTPVWIREFGIYDGNNTYFFNSTTSETVYSFGSGYGNFNLEPGLYFLHALTANQAQCSGPAGSDTDAAFFYVTMVGYTPSCVQDFMIQGFSHTSHISTVRNAHVAEQEGVLRLTDAESGQTGAAWYLDKANVAPGFTTSFTFQISGGSADGMAFLIQDESPVAVGAGGGSLGYSTGVQPEGDVLFGITRSVAIEFDTFGFGGEFETPHISVQTDGTAFNSADDGTSLAVATVPQIADGLPHAVKVAYVPGNLKVFLDDILYIDTFLNLEDINGQSILDENGCAWIGFTAGTGAATANQDILDWTLGEGCTTGFDLDSLPVGSIQAVGDASVSGSEVLSLTQDLSSQRGAGWYPSKAHLAGGFETSFTFEILGAAGGIGDGMAFVIQDESATALGGGGSAMGYGNENNPGITRSLAVEIDTFSFGEPGEFNAPHISVQTNGIGENSNLDPYSLGHASIPNVVNDGWHVCRVVYVPGEMDVYFDHVLYLTVNIDLESVESLDAGGFDTILDASGCAWIGFTAGTGGASAEHDVLTWSFSNTPCTTPLDIAANLNGDCEVDANDLAILEACQTGPAVPYDSFDLPPGCTLAPDENDYIAADFDRDGDVDQVDFARLQRCYGDSGTANPNCMD